MSPLLSYYLLLLLGFSVCLFAMWRGNPAERYGAEIILGVFFLQQTATMVLPASWAPIVGLCADALPALGLLALTMGFTSPWLGAVMLFYAAQFTLHSYYFVTERPRDLLHAWVNNLDFVGIILCLAIGTLVSRHRRVRATAIQPSLAST